MSDYDYEYQLDTTLFPTISLDSKEFSTRSLTELLMSQSPQPRRKGFCMSLYLPAVREPISIWNTPLITIGRRDMRNQVFPTIDLTEHHASMLGVSRLHAQIIYRYSNFYILDLASKNGTWVNKLQLKPHEPTLISHHDTLRIGHLILHIGACQYEEEKEEEKEKEPSNH